MQLFQRFDKKHIFITFSTESYVILYHSVSTVSPQVDILLVGVGPYSTQPSPSFMAACKQHGIGLEVQTTPQAVQTYQILLQDKRNFASLMIPSSRKTLGSYERKLLEDSKKNLVRRSPGNKKGLRKT